MQLICLAVFENCPNFKSLLADWKRMSPNLCSASDYSRHLPFNTTNQLERIKVDISNSIFLPTQPWSVQNPTQTPLRRLSPQRFSTPPPPTVSKPPSHISPRRRPRYKRTRQRQHNPPIIQPPPPPHPLPRLHPTPLLSLLPPPYPTILVNQFSPPCHHLPIPRRHNQGRIWQDTEHQSSCE